MSQAFRIKLVKRIDRKKHEIKDITLKFSKYPTIKEVVLAVEEAGFGVEYSVQDYSPITK